MKRFLLLLTVSLALPVLAEQGGDILLPSGTSVTLGGITITCQGSANPNLPKCSVSPWDGNIHQVYVGGSMWGKAPSFQTAVDIVTQLKKSGICQ